MEHVPPGRVAYLVAELLPRPADSSDSVFVTTAVETAVSGAHKSLHTGEVSASLNFFALVVDDGLSGR